MNKPNDVTGCFDASNCSTAIPRLTDEQRLELAACYAEYCGVDPQVWQSKRETVTLFCQL